MYSKRFPVKMSKSGSIYNELRRYICKNTSTNLFFSFSKRHSQFPMNLINFRLGIFIVCDQSVSNKNSSTGKKILKARIMIKIKTK